MVKNLAALVDCGRHLQLSEATMASTLASNSLKGFSEMDLYHIAREWLDHDHPSRRSSVYALIRHIRFPLMSRAELFQISQDDQEEGGSVMRSETACANLLLEACNYQMMPFMQPGLQTERTQIRSDATHIVVLGGVMRQQLVVSKELRLYDEKFEHWRALKAMEEPRYQHGVALLGGFLFIVGGQNTSSSVRSGFDDRFSPVRLGSSGQSTYDTKGKTAIDSAYRYDPRFDKWLQIASLNEKRTFFHLSALAGKLFAVGGRNTAGEIGKPPPCGVHVESAWAAPHGPVSCSRHGGVLQHEEKRMDLCHQHGGASLWTRRHGPRGSHVRFRYGNTDGQRRAAALDKEGLHTARNLWWCGCLSVHHVLMVSNAKLYIST